MNLTPTCLCVASRTLRTFPFRGNTPYLSLPTTPKPATARDLAESPSVRIRVQSREFLVPASLASSNFGIPFIFEVLLEVSFLFNWVCALNFIQLKMLSTIPHLLTFNNEGNFIESITDTHNEKKPYLKHFTVNSFGWSTCRITWLMNFSERVHFDPNCLACNVIDSLVCESNVGFSIRQLTNIQRWFFTYNRKHGCVVCKHIGTSFKSQFFNINSLLLPKLTWKGLIAIPPLFFFFTTSISLVTTWSVTLSTCLPPCQKFDK